MQSAQLWLFSAAVIVSLSACSGNPASTTPVAAVQTAPALHPGDAIRVQVWREPDLSGTFEVDDRGIVVLPLLGERTVTGLSPDDLRDALLEDYAEYLQNPSVQVTLLRRINILGEVRSQGLYPVDATISLADALALAGGITPNGNPDDIRLIRGDQVIRQNLDRATLVGSAEIRSGDQIVVGQRSWASRNSTAILGSFIAASAIIAAALIR
jgi:polysaccharide export outer membrane protein